MGARGRLGLFLTARQILFLRRAALAAGIPNDEEMQDLADSLKNSQELVLKDKVNGWGGNYEWDNDTAVESFPATVARRTRTGKDWQKNNHYKSDPNIL